MMNKEKKDTTDTKETYRIGIFQTQEDADAAISLLSRNGFKHDDLSMIVSERSKDGHFAFHKETRAPEGVAAGGSIGAAIGGLAVGLAAVGAIALPGLGLFAVGPLVAALAGAGAAGTAGGIVGGLVGLGFDKTEARFYEEQVAAGNILLAVRCHDESEQARAKDILELTRSIEFAA